MPYCFILLLTNNENLEFFFFNTGLLLSLAETHDFCFHHNDMGVEILRNYGRINYCINILWRSSGANVNYV